MTHGHKKLSLKVHPIIEAYLKKGWPSRQMKLSWEYKRWIRIKGNSNYHLTEYHFSDAPGEDIKL
jgi:ribonuclease G